MILLEWKRGLNKRVQFLHPEPSEKFQKITTTKMYNVWCNLIVMWRVFLYVTKPCMIIGMKKKKVFFIVIMHCLISSCEDRVEKINGLLTELVSAEEAKTEQTLVQRIPLSIFYNKLLACHPCATQEEEYLKDKNWITVNNVSNLTLNVYRSLKERSMSTKNLEVVLSYMEEKLKDIKENYAVHKNFKMREGLNEESVDIVGFDNPLLDAGSTAFLPFLEPKRHCNNLHDGSSGACLGSSSRASPLHFLESMNRYNPTPHDESSDARLSESSASFLHFLELRPMSHDESSDARLGGVSRASPLRSLKPTPHDESVLYLHFAESISSDNNEHNASSDVRAGSVSLSFYSP